MNMERASGERRLSQAGSIPDAPFRKDWPMQMFKRALADAVGSGKEWIGWTNGETQAARYDLSKHVDRIVIGPSATDGLMEVRAYKGGFRVINRGNIKPEEIQQFVGKDLAKKAMDDGAFNKDQEYSGLNLKVGGEGMKGFYDQILPKEISKYVKQWGGKVEKVDIGLANAVEELRFDLVRPDGRALTAFLTKVEAQAAAKKAGKGYTVREAPLKNPTPIWRVNITPQMRESIKKAGQSLFVGGAAAVVAEEEMR
jgi:hypothetical protein